MARGAILVDAQKTVRVPRRAHRVNRRLQAAVGVVLQTDRHGKAAGHFAMRLRFRRARANRRPRDQVGDVLRHDGVQKFRRRRQPHAGDFQQQPPRNFQARFDVLRPVEVRIVDQTLPADGGARFFEIDAHDDFQAVGELLAQGIEPRCILQRALFVVNRAGTDDDEQARVFLAQDAHDPFAAARDGGVDRIGRRRLRLQFAGRQQPDDFFDV